MEEFDSTLVEKAHAQLMRAMSKEGFAPTAGIGAPPQGGMPMDPAMAGGAPPMDPAMAGGAPPMDPAMAGGAMPPGAPPMDPAAGGGAPPMPGGGQMPPVMVSLEDLMALFSQIAQETGGGGGAPAEGAPDTTGALDEITQRLEGIETALGIGAPAGPVPGEVGAMPPPPEMPAMPPMGEAMPPIMEATAAPMPGMPVVASGGDGQIKSGRAEKIGDLVAKLRRK